MNRPIADRDRRSSSRPKKTGGLTRNGWENIIIPRTNDKAHFETSTLIPGPVVFANTTYIDLQTRVTNET